MPNRIHFIHCLLPVICVILLSTQSCRKIDSIDTSSSAYLNFSTKLVEFDTVFTTEGSATHNFTVRNPNKKAINISDIMLQGGINSPFRINIDGNPTTNVLNKQVAAGDSFYIFA